MRLGDGGAVAIGQPYEIDAGYEAWPFSGTTISIQVNGKDYVIPEVATIVASIRSQFATGDAAKNRKECEEFPVRVAGLAQRMPMEALSAFVAPLKR